MTIIFIGLAGLAVGCMLGELSQRIEQRKAYKELLEHLKDDNEE